MARPPRNRGGSYRPAWLRLGVIALALVALYSTMALTGHTTPKLGLDLRGGTTVTLKPRLASGHGKVDSGAIDQAVDIIRNRVNGLGVSEADVVRAGSRIEISVPGKGRQQVLDLVGTTAELRFRQVAASMAGTATGSPSTAPSTVPPNTSSNSPSPAPKSPSPKSPSPKSSTKPSTKPSASGATPGAASAPGLSAPTANPAASKRVLSQGLVAVPVSATFAADVTGAAATPATKPTPATEPSAATNPASPAPSAPAGTQPTRPKACEGLSTKSTNNEPSPYTMCLYETVKCPTYKPDTLAEKATDWAVACEKDNSVKYLLMPAAVKGTDVKGATATVDSNPGSVGQWQVVVSFTGHGQNKFTDLTRATIGKQVAIVLDGVVESAPVTNQVIPGDAQITGQFTQKEATDLANVLKYGALPLAFDRDQAQSISPTLGSQSLHAGLLAGAIGLGLVIIYSFIYYRALGIVTVISLGVSALLVYASVVLLGQAIGFTLTLAGIAGLIVSVGITADSFVVYFERLKDEIHDGRTVRTAVEVGWSRARRTILSADTVSFLAAVILYEVSIGSVKGFAFTLGLSTLLDVAVVFLFTKPLLTLLLRRRFFASGRFSGLSATALGTAPTVGRYRARPRSSGPATARTGGGDA